MILDEPWVIAADQHRLGKATIVQNCHGTFPIVLHSYINRSSFLHIHAAVVVIRGLL